MSPVWLEEPCPLPESLLWTRHVAFYNERGVGVWSDDLVPTQVTTNTYIGQAYAGMILDQVRSMGCDPREPVHVVELGAGSGRLAFHVVHALRRMTGPDDPRIVYVMTELVAKSVRAWQGHPQLQALVELGLLDMGVFDCESPRAIELRYAQRPLLDCAEHNPIVLLANYVFDSLRHDLIQVWDGRACRVWVRAGVSKKHRPRLHLVPQRDSELVYDDPDVDALVETYRRELERTRVLVPVVAVQMLRWWMDKAKGGLLLLLADKMQRSLADLDYTRHPDLVSHGDEGCISVVVNAQAIAHLFEGDGGQVRHSRSYDDSFTISAFLSSSNGEFGGIFDRWLDDPGPADVQRLLDAVEELKDPPIALLLPLLRAACYDDFVIDRLFEPLLKSVGLATPTQLLDLADVLREVWRRSFWVTVEEDLPFDLGRLYSAMGEHSDGVQMYLESLQTKGPHRATYYNLALSCEGLDDLSEAHRYMDLALQMSPSYKRALKWKADSKAEVQPQE